MVRFRSILGCCAIAFCTVSLPAVAAGPVVLEYFGQNNCGKDLDMQLRFHEFVRTGQDVIFINCRTTDSAKIGQDHSEEEQDNEGDVPLYYNDFCTKRSEAYSLKNGELYRKSLLVMVNGRWVANNDDVLPAINLGATDNLGKIGMVREGEALQISVPTDITLPKDGKGKLSLFVYVPSTGIDIGKPQDVALKNTARREVLAHKLDGYKRLVPLEDEAQEEKVTNEAITAEEQWEEIIAKQKKEVDSKSHYFRPVAAMEEIGVWDGSKAQYDFSLATIAAQTGLSPEEMGYVAILQEGGGGAAPVIAAGEIVPVGEQMSLTSSEAPTEPGE